MKTLEDALARNDLTAAVNAVPWSKLEELQPELTADLQDVLNKAGKAAAKLLPKEITIVFDATNPEAIKWIENHAADLVNEVLIAQGKEGIKEIMLDAFNKGIPPREAAKLIKDQIGLLPRQSIAVANYKDHLINVKGLSIAEADKLAAKYADKLLTQRAETIAQTETMTAANEGQRELWRQGVSAGELKLVEWEKLWIVTNDRRLCPQCEALDGSSSPLDGSYPSGGGEGPPLHVLCRCVETLARVA